MYDDVRFPVGKQALHCRVLNATGHILIAQDPRVQYTRTSLIVDRQYFPPCASKRAANCTTDETETPCHERSRVSSTSCQHTAVHADHPVRYLVQRQTPVTKPLASAENLLADRNLNVISNSIGIVLAHVASGYSLH